MENTPDQVTEHIISCRKCPRLVAWREKVAQEKTRRFADWQYWGKPVPAFGQSEARLFIVGLAPAAHGANRTGRMFTGDRSGDWLFRALHKFGFATQAHSHHRGDGLELHDCFITALCRCAPPGNKPTAEEFSNCSGFLRAELLHFLNLLNSTPGAGVILLLGQQAFAKTLRMLHDLGLDMPPQKPRFAHGLSLSLSPKLTLLASYHPSQQNTFTGRLTEPMFDKIFEQIRRELEHR